MRMFLISQVIAATVCVHASATIMGSPLWERSKSEMARDHLTLNECCEALLKHYSKDSLFFKDLTAEIFVFRLPRGAAEQRRDIRIPACPFGEAVSRVAVIFELGIQVNDVAIVFGKEPKSDYFIGISPVLLGSMVNIPVGNELEGLSGNLRLGQASIRIKNYHIRDAVLELSCDATNYARLLAAVELVRCGVKFERTSVRFEAGPIPASGG